MTNGEKFQELFPDLELEIYCDVVRAYEWKFRIVANKKWWNSEYREPTTEDNLEVDCISREQALNEFCIYNLYDNIGVDKVRNYLKALPSVTPQEPRKGHWGWLRCDMYVCSECKNVYTDLSGIKDGMNYCPNCGSRNEVEE